MSQSEKSAYYQALKKAGAEFAKPYRNYTVAELKEAYDLLAAAGAAPPLDFSGDDVEPQVNGIKLPPLAEKDPNELPAQRMNTQAENEPIRVDDKGLIWYQEEVAKPAIARARGRRVLRYNDPGVEEKTVLGANGEVVETFEVGGRQSIPSEVKITLPSYQVGIYKDPRFPFKIHTYNGVNGFSLFEVQDFYGGAELVPEDVKRIYVANDLCYDVRTTVRAITKEHRQLQLAGRIDS